jgi:hypothetical protein
MSGRPYYQEDWFEYGFIGACFMVGYLLFKGLMPYDTVSTDTIQNLAMAKLFADNRWLEAFSQFNLPPIYPLLMALVIKSRHTTDLPMLLSSFQMLNLFLYGISIILVHYFVRRQIEKPYIFAITALYALAPPTLNMLWSLDSQMAYMVASMATLYAIDYALSPDSHLGGLLSQRELEFCGSMIGLSILTHQLGYLLLLAFFAILYKRFGVRKGLSVLGTLLLCLSPFIGRDVFGAIRTSDTYFASSRMFFQQANRYGFINATEDYADRVVYAIAHQAVGNLNLTTLDRVAPSRSQPTGPNRIALARTTWARWLLAILAITGAGYALYLYTGVGTLYLCIYTLTALVFLPQYNLSLAPVLPLLLFSLYFGILKAGDWSRPMNIPAARILGTVLTGWILLCSFSEHLAHARGGLSGMIRRAQTGKIMYMNTSRKPENRLEVAQTDSAHRRVNDWLKKHTETSSTDLQETDETPRKRRGRNKGREDYIDLSADEGEGESDVVTLTGEDGKPGGGRWTFGPEQSDYIVEENSNRITPLEKSGVPPSRRGLKLVYEDVQGRIRIWQIRRKG